MRSLLAFLFVGAVLLAGCVKPNENLTTASTIAPPQPAGGTTGVLHTLDGKIVAAAAGTPLAVGGEYPTGLGATEPTIGVTKDGAVFMTALRPNPEFKGEPYLPYAGMQNGPTLVRTTDKGQSFKDTFAPLPTGDSKELRTWDPYVYVDVDTGRVFMDDIYPLGCGTLSFSDDKGESWTTDPVSCGNPNVNDHQTLVAAKPRMLPTVGYPKIVYRCVNDIAFSACARSLNGGLSFLPQVPVATQSDGCSALTGHLKADKDGRVYLPFECNGLPAYAVTEDDGSSWKIVTISKDAKTDDHEVGLAFDDAGNLFAVWPNKDMLYFSSSADHGKTWAPAKMIAAPGVTGTQFGAIAAGGAGEVAIAYVGTTVPGGFEGKKDGDCDLATGVCTEGSGWENATWNGYLTLTTDALNANGTWQTVTANDPMDPLARGYCGHSRCHGMNDFLDVVIDGDGRPWASFVDVCTQKCVTDPATHYDKAVGFVATLQSGPSLRGAPGALLASIAPPPMAGMQMGH